MARYCIFWTILISASVSRSELAEDSSSPDGERYGSLDYGRAPVLVYSDSNGLRKIIPGQRPSVTRTRRDTSKKEDGINETKPITYDVEMTVLMDYSLFQWFYDFTKEPDRRNKTIQKMRHYYAKVIQGAYLVPIRSFDLTVWLKSPEMTSPERVIPQAGRRYDTLRKHGLDIKLWLKYYVIIEDRQSSFFTENPWVREGMVSRRRRVNSIKGLVALRFWDLNRNLSMLSKSDHVMAFTRYNLYRLSRDKRKARDQGVGIAFAESICTTDSFSLIEEKGGFKSAPVAAHELGHSLGAFYHDGEEDSASVNCSADDLYVMAPVNKLAAHWNRPNVYQFSSCSIQQIRQFLSKPNASWCLKDGGESVTDWKTNTDVLPGQYMNVHEQCRHRAYNGSQLCGFRRDDICQDLWCTLAGRDGGCVSTGPAAWGTTCANKKMCLYSACTQTDDAPNGNDFCLYGDHPSALTYRHVPCHQFITSHPGRCYNRAVNERCCHSCSLQLRPHRPDCSYGDNLRVCSTLPRFRCADPKIKWHCCQRCTGYRLRCTDRPWFRLYGHDCYSLIATFGKRRCYDARVARYCCRTCRRYRRHDNPGCMFGDRYEFVYRNQKHIYGYNCDKVATEPEKFCQLYDIRKDCCETCAYYY